VPVTIREITSEIVVGGEATPPGAAGPEGGRPGEEELVERVVRRALERVLERLRLEWEP
jgi:hypothetical protein